MKNKFKPALKFLFIGAFIISVCSAGAVVIAGNFRKNDDMKFTAEIVDDSQNVLDTIPFGVGVKGDSDCDGKLTIRDAALIARYMARAYNDKNLVIEFKKTLGGAMSDVNLDGDVNIRDAASIARYLAARYTNPDIEWDY